MASREGLDVRHIRSFLASDDEICFHLFEATSAEVVASMSELARFNYERISEVIE